MCQKAVDDEPEALKFVPFHLKTQEMRNKAVHIEPPSLTYIPDHLKTEKMYYKAVKDDSSSLQFVSDWFISRGWVDCGMMTTMMMMLVIGVMMMMMMMIKINFLNGTMVMKKKGSKSKNKRRALTHCLAPIKVEELVYTNRRKKRDRKIVEITMGFFCVW